MANTYPYVASGGPLIKAVDSLRKSFPKSVTADTLRKLGIAPNNESYVINILRFLGVIDEEGKKVDEKAAAFVHHDPKEFQKAFGELVHDAYAELFELRGDEAWTMDVGALTQFFRTSDHSSDIVGSRQARTFTSLAAIAGHIDQPQVREPAVRPSAKGPKPARQASPREKPTLKVETPSQRNQQVGLTVRVEVNLPATGDQETYDRIFQSIRKNLIDAE